MSPESSIPSSWGIFPSSADSRQGGLVLRLRLIRGLWPGSIRRWLADQDGCNLPAPLSLVRELQDKLKAELEKLYRSHPGAHGITGVRSVATNASGHVGKRWDFNIGLEVSFPQ